MTHAPTRHPVVTNPPVVPNRQARRLFLDRHLLLRPGTGAGSGRDLEDVLGRLGFVQLDSVNTLARAHDLILWSRRGRYRPAALEHLVARRRTAFEHWTHDAAVIPIDLYPMWRLKFERDEARLRARWPTARREGWHVEIDAVLRHVADHGPTSSLDVRGGGCEVASGKGSAGKASSGWWDWHPSKTALEFLWRSGRLAVSHRQGFRKHYDLSERVVAPEHLNAPMDDAEIVERAMVLSLERLGFATSGELAAFHDIVRPAEAKAWTAAALASGRIVEVDVAMADGSLRRSLTTEAILGTLDALPQPSGRVRVLSPFDPALRDRARAERLFGFSYRIEIFVPAARRRYGYYVFPVLRGDRLVGRLDARRVGAALAVRAFWPEAGVRPGAKLRVGLDAELNRLRHLTGSERVEFEEGWWRG